MKKTSFGGFNHQMTLIELSRFFLFKVKRVKRFEFRFDSAAFECLDGFSQGIISLNRWDSLGELR